MTRTLALVSVVAFLTFTATATHAAVDPAVACAVAKQKAAAKKLSDKVKCYGNALKKGESVDPTCLVKAETKFEASFTRAEDRGGCATTSDSAYIEALIDSVLGALLQLLPAATTTTTTTTLPSATCSDDGDTACFNTASAGACQNCCLFDPYGNCPDACAGAQMDVCSRPDLNAQCSAAVDAAGCAGSCCP